MSSITCEGNKEYFQPEKNKFIFAPNEHDFSSSVHSGAIFNDFSSLIIEVLRKENLWVSQEDSRSTSWEKLPGLKGERDQ